MSVDVSVVTTVIAPGVVDVENDGPSPNYKISEYFASFMRSDPGGLNIS
jgi:hypothetical protein